MLGQDSATLAVPLLAQRVRAKTLLLQRGLACCRRCGTDAETTMQDNASTNQPQPTNHYRVTVHKMRKSQFPTAGELLNDLTIWTRCLSPRLQATPMEDKLPCCKRHGFTARFTTRCTPAACHWPQYGITIRVKGCCLWTVAPGM